MNPIIALCLIPCSCIDIPSSSCQYFYFLIRADPGVLPSSSLIQLMSKTGGLIDWFRPPPFTWMETLINFLFLNNYDTLTNPGELNVKHDGVFIISMFDSLFKLFPRNSMTFTAVITVFVKNIIISLKCLLIA